MNYNNRHSISNVFNVKGEVTQENMRFSHSSWIDPPLDNEYLKRGVVTKH